jgi:hypothetical protein
VIINLSLLLRRHLFSSSGSGKTRLTLDGLCANWGFYISCKSNEAHLSGSSDFETATGDIISRLSSWKKGSGDEFYENNYDCAQRVFTMLLCARVFVMSKLIEKFPPETAVKDARRRWVFLQVMPPVHRFRGDMFRDVLWTLRSANSADMEDFIKGGFTRMGSRVDLFPGHERFFVVIDEAQVAADALRVFMGPSKKERPLLFAVYQFFIRSYFPFTGIIICGTGLSIAMIREATLSLTAKFMKWPNILFFETGLFDEESIHTKYIDRYLTLSQNVLSDKRLYERIRRWFPGR